MAKKKNSDINEIFDTGAETNMSPNAVFSNMETNVSEDNNYLLSFYSKHSGQKIDEGIDIAHSFTNRSSLARIGGTTIPTWNGSTWPGGGLGVISPETTVVDIPSGELLSVIEGNVSGFEILEKYSEIDNPTGVMGYPAITNLSQSELLEVWGSVEGVGDLVTDNADPNYGKYRITVEGMAQPEYQVRELFDNTIFVRGTTSNGVTNIGKPFTTSASTNRLTIPEEELIDVSGMSKIVIINNTDGGKHHAPFFYDSGIILITQGVWISNETYEINVPTTAKYLCMNIRKYNDATITLADLSPSDFSINGYVSEEHGTSPTAYLTKPLYDANKQTFRNIKITETLITSDTINKPNNIYIRGIDATGNFDELLKYPDMRIGCLGSSTTDTSITAGGTTTNSVNYPSILKTLLGCTVYNYGKSGSTISNLFDGATLSAYTRVDDMVADLDIIIVQGAGNDYAKPEVILGNLGDTTNQTYYGSCDMLVKKLKVKYPNALLLYTTTPKNIPGSVNLENFTNAFLAVARNHGLSAIDVYFSNDEPATIISGNLPDGAHMGPIAVQTYAELMAQTIRFLLQRNLELKQRIKFPTWNEVQKMIDRKLMEISNKE